MMDEEIDDVVEESAANDGLHPDAARKIQTAQVLPLHTASGSHTKNAPGRAKGVKTDGKSVARPTVDQLRYNAEMQEAEVRFVESDALVKAARDKANTKEVLHLLVLQAAQNAAALDFQRIEKQKRGEDTAQHISRHTKVLRDLAAFQTELREMGQQTIDPYSEGFQKVFKLWVEKIQAVVVEILTPEQSDLFFTKFAASMENWEEQAESVLR